MCVDVQSVECVSVLPTGRSVASLCSCRASLPSILYTVGVCECLCVCVCRGGEGEPDWITKGCLPMCTYIYTHYICTVCVCVFVFYITTKTPAVRKTSIVEMV